MIQLDRVLHELDQPNINYKNIGELIGESRFRRYFLSHFSNQTQPRLVGLINKVKGIFHTLENKAVKTYAPHLARESEAYRQTFRPYFKFIEKMETEAGRLTEVSYPLKKALDELGRLKVGLRYRLGAANGGVDPLPQPDPELLAKLEQYLIDWKRGQSLTRDFTINPLEQEALREAARYSEWVPLLDDPHYRKEFMSWSIKDWLPVDAFIQYEGKRKWIKDSLLASALGHARSNTNEMLKVEQVATRTADVTKKILSLPIYHGEFRQFQPNKQSRFSLLNPEKEVTFEQGNYRVKIKEIMRQWSLKNDIETNFSLCQWGMINFHPTHGRYNADTQSYDDSPTNWPRENWVERMPPARVFTQAEMEQRYGAPRMAGRDLLVSAGAARTHRDMTALGCHAFWKIDARMPDGNWKTFYPGPFGPFYPTHPLHQAYLFGGTLPFTMVGFDQNQYLPMRERAILPLDNTPAEGTAILNRIHHYMANESVFQFSGRNCGYWVQKAIQDTMVHIPNLYRVPLTICRARLLIIDPILAFAHNRMEWLKTLIVGMVHTFLGSHRGIYVRERALGEAAHREVFYNTRSFFQQEGHVIYNPSYLFKQIEEGVEPFNNGQIYWTPTEERLLRAETPVV